MHINCYKYRLSLRMTIEMNYLAIIEEITAYGHLIRMTIIPKFTLYISLISFCISCHVSRNTHSFNYRSFILIVSAMTNYSFREKANMIFMYDALNTIMIGKLAPTCLYVLNRIEDTSNLL